MAWFDAFPRHKTVAERRADAAREVQRLTRAGRKLSPVQIEGKKLATTFWGKAWNQNLERYSDFETRLPRGRSYVKNGLVIDLRIEKGKVAALVSGSELYEVDIQIAPVRPKQWDALVTESAGGIGSLVELLSGRLSDRVMEILCRPGTGLFPEPKEIELDCSCPDGAYLCKHLAAVLYGIGARLDTNPELLFVLRGVDAEALVAAAASRSTLVKAGTKAPTIPKAKLGAIFGIEVEDGPVELPKVKKPKRKNRGQASRS